MREIANLFLEYTRDARVTFFMPDVSVRSPAGKEAGGDAATLMRARMQEQGIGEMALSLTGCVECAEPECA